MNEKYGGPNPATKKIVKTLVEWRVDNGLLHVQPPQSTIFLYYS